MYGKLFQQMYFGTLRAAGWEALVTFQQLVILANRHGEVDMTPVALSALTGIPQDVLERGIAILEQPDAGSRTPDEDGRRIVRLDDARSWGWRLVNYQHYRQIRSEDERRQYQREWQAKRRAAARAESTGVNKKSTQVNSRQSRQKLTHAVSSKQKAVSITDACDNADAEADFERAWSAYPKRPNNSKAAARKAWDRARRDGATVADLQAGTDAYAAYCEATQPEPRFIKLAATFYGPDRHWESAYPLPEPQPAPRSGTATSGDLQPIGRYVAPNAPRAPLTVTLAGLASEGVLKVNERPAAPVASEATP